MGGFFIFAWYPTYAPRRIAQTLILSLTRVDAMPGAGLSLVILAKLALLMRKSKGCVYFGYLKPLLCLGSRSKLFPDPNPYLGIETLYSPSLRVEVAICCFPDPNPYLGIETQYLDLITIDSNLSLPGP